VSTEGFDRLRRRSPAAKRSRPAVGKRPADPQGRRSLYSIAEQPPAAGAITVACSRCGETSVATPRQVVGLALPSLHLPILRREHPSWMRCPACGQRAWVRLGLRL
jgi:predicted RNA-binding Zn-ribbon protein involved in translation (DUF1610 family)